MKILRRVLLVVFILIGALLIAGGSYFGYVYFQFYRIEDNLELEVDKPTELKGIDFNDTFSVSSYNVGFGAYTQDFSFFLDEGYLNDGSTVVGKESRAKSKDSVLESTNGAANTIKAYNPDFAFFQEVDIKADRSHDVNQYEIFKDVLNSYSAVFANNFHTAYLLYPLLKPIGSSKSGIVTMSKYNILKSVRKSFSVSDKFMEKIFDLDRCFSVSYVPINNTNKELVLVNIHMSAYDEGGLIREKQINELNSFLNQEYRKGNYIVAGGDFNHDLLYNNPDYLEYTDGDLPFKEQFTERTPDWLSFMFNADRKNKLNEGFKIVASNNSPSVRTADIEWIPGKTYVATVDGFIVSNNIEVVEHMNLRTRTADKEGFAYSDHEPATMKFKLK